jgi:hypothetical protein
LIRIVAPNMPPLMLCMLTMEAVRVAMGAEGAARLRHGPLGRAILWRDGRTLQRVEAKRDG